MPGRRLRVLGERTSEREGPGREGGSPLHRSGSGARSGDVFSSDVGRKAAAEYLRRLVQRGGWYVPGRGPRREGDSTGEVPNRDRKRAQEEGPVQRGVRRRQVPLRVR